MTERARRGRGLGVVAAVLPALLCGCGGGETSPTVGAVPAAQAIEGVRWEPVAVGDRRTEGSFLTFDDATHWHASDGCTTSQGTYQFFPKADGRVAVQRVGDLRPAQRCEGVPTSSALEQSAFLRVDGGKLLLVSANDQVVLRMEPATSAS